MNDYRFGEYICKLRSENNLSQKKLAEMLGVSDKAVSKWERGNGCPDISLLSGLAGALGTDVHVLLSGESVTHESEKGDMKKVQFYICRECGNIITAASEAAVTCCGNKLTSLEPRRAAEEEMLKTEDIGGEWYVSSDHEMTKEHYISFVAYVSDSIFMMFRQYPEWNLQFTMPMFRTGRLVWYCNRCGLLYQDINPRRRNG